MIFTAGDRRHSRGDCDCPEATLQSIYKTWHIILVIYPPDEKYISLVAKFLKPNKIPPNFYQ